MEFNVDFDPDLEVVSSWVAHSTTGEISSDSSLEDEQFRVDEELVGFYLEADDASNQDINADAVDIEELRREKLYVFNNGMQEELK